MHNIEELKAPLIKGGNKMETYKYINNYTGEIYKNLFHAVITIISDMIHCPGCRTFKMLNISKNN